MNLFRNPHANQRYFERVSPDAASKKDIVKALQHPDNIQYIKRLTESRSMAYIHLPNSNIVKVIINKKKKELVTILPWRDVYKTELITFIEELGLFNVELYPDCFRETVSMSTLNKVTKIERENEQYVFENISFSHNIFETVFAAAWLDYCGLDNDTT